MRQLDLRNLYYVTHRDNLPSIFEKGILSHERIEDNQDKRQVLPHATSAHNARAALPDPQAPANRLVETDRSASQIES